MLIVGEANNANIELSESEGLARPAGAEYYHVTLRENEFTASRPVYAFDPTGNSLSKFFSELLADWKGWDGVRAWSSLEGEFRRTCEHDGLGHVTTTATLLSNPLGRGWLGQIRLDMAAGNLDEIAAEVARFFEATSRE
jgi:hypothetical protein